MVKESPPHFSHHSGDQVLNVLSDANGLICDFVRSFPGKNNVADCPTWLEDWFINRTQTYFNSVTSLSIDFISIEEGLSNIINQPNALLSKPTKLLSIQPYYFRGFRNLTEPINLFGSLIVIDGRNSSGKTSLAEAFEWLLTGQLIRRRMQQFGDARELENCITNQFKPEDEETFVEATFVTESNKQFILKRVLRRDYGATQTSIPESILYLDGKEFTLQAEKAYLDSLFAGIPPILMQHSLRLFINNTPKERRNYFERLLRLDELTCLIEHAVIGNARLSEFPNPIGSVAIKQWESFKIILCQKNSIAILRKVEKDRSKDLPINIRNALVEVANIEFSDIFKDESDIGHIRDTLLKIQKIERQKSFPLLEELRPKRIIDESLEEIFSSKKLEPWLTSLNSAYSKFTTAEKAAELIGQAQIVVTKAIEELLKANIIIEISEPQICPLCDFKEIPTLTRERILTIQSWQPIQKAAEDAKNELIGNITGLLTAINEIYESKHNLLPVLPKEEEKTAALLNINEQISLAACKCIKTLEECSESTVKFDTLCLELINVLQKQWINDEDLTALSKNIKLLNSYFDNILQTSRNYQNSFSELEKTIGTEAREDPIYNLRELWLSVSENPDAIVVDLKWEHAKDQAQAELEKIRNTLIEVRKKLLDQRRVDFNKGMSTIWNKLRADRYSSFSQLFIPEPRGRGFPVEIEVKALLDDGSQKREVDALRVFSESQVNVLGIAAFTTRSKMLGHKLLILDDPVQSMDEEHFKTFACELLPELISNDTQVIILTHNDTFAKELSYACYENDDYVTMKLRLNRKMGCQLEEGNRRVSERLKKAEKEGEDGRFDNAWRYVRLALERLYTITYIKHGPKNFNPLSWSDQTAEYMWNDGSGNGVGVLIENMIPGSGKRLKEILKMTAAGAHDKSAKGFTDLINAINDIRAMLPNLRVGSG